MQTLVTGNIFEAAALIQAGQTVIFPTETVYGLGGDALNTQAVAAIFAAKRRPADNPLIVHIWQPEQVSALAQGVPAYAWDLIEQFFPGPFTLLLEKQPHIPAITTAGSSKVCLRMPGLSLARQFLEACGRPVAAPSANLSGRPSPTRWQDCLEDMEGRVAAILTGPEAHHGLESTIVDASGPQPVLLRPGAVTLEQLRQVTPDIELNPTRATAVTPGSKYRHYAPAASVIPLGAGQIPARPCSASAYIGLNPPHFETAYSYRAASIEDYARHLFAFFRECDRRQVECIYTEIVEAAGLGLALMNRLNKAAAPSDVLPLP